MTISERKVDDPNALARRQERDQRKPVMAFVLIAAVSAMIGCSKGASPTSSLVSMFKSQAGKSYDMSLHRRKALIGPPISGVYLGALVDPNPTQIPSPGPSYLEEETEKLESPSEMNRTLALHLEYRNWTKMAALTTGDPQIAGDIANHRAPVISWTCADDIVPSPEPSGWKPYNLVQIANGDADADLVKIKSALASIKAPGQTASYPIIVRWFWEFNINAAQSAPYNNPDIQSSNESGDTNGNGGCFVTPYTLTNIPHPNSTAPPLNIQFQNAWIHIYNLFTGVQPAPPVTFVWNPNVSTTLNGYPDASSYFPGPDYVDWIAADGYAKLDNGSPPAPQSFSQIFAGWYTEYDNSTYGNKPLMIGETGSCQYYGPPEQTQGGYIANLQFLFDNDSSPVFPEDIKAVNYFDAAGNYDPDFQPCTWSFSHADGLPAWETLGSDTFFSPTVPGT